MPTYLTVSLTFCLTLLGALIPWSGDASAYSGMAFSPVMNCASPSAAGHLSDRYAPINLRSYDKLIVDPVAFYRGRDHEIGEMSEANKSALAAIMRIRFAERLSSRFTIVHYPFANTLRLRLILKSAAINAPVASMLSPFDVPANLYNGMHALWDGESFLHEDLLRDGLLNVTLNYCVELYDAPSSRLIMAFTAQQYGSLYDVIANLSPLEAAEAGIDRGANALLAQLQ